MLYLRGKADVFERFILAPAAEDVRQWSEGVFVHGRTMAGLFEQDAPQARHRQGQNAVHEHQKLGIFKALAAAFHLRGAVGARHHPLLKDAPCQVWRLDDAQNRWRLNLCTQLNYSVASNWHVTQGHYLESSSTEDQFEGLSSWWTGFRVVSGRRWNIIQQSSFRFIPKHTRLYERKANPTAYRNMSSV